MKVPSISDESIQIATGKSWAEWLVFLKKINAENLLHKEIASALMDQSEVSGWWAQAITVEFERMIGRRALGQSCEGDFQASASKTISGTMDKVYKDWQEFVKDIDQFHQIPFSNSPKNSSTEKWRYWRVGLQDGSRISLIITQKSLDKVLLSVNHEKLANPKAVEGWNWKVYWKTFLRDFHKKVS